MPEGKSLIDVLDIAYKINNYNQSLFYRESTKNISLIFTSMDKLRQIVGGPKNRFKQSGYNLDLTYITPRLIAMAFPGSGLEKLYRNSIDDVVKFFMEVHAGSYLVINLSGRDVNQSKLHNVMSFDWQDHNAPPFQTMFKICDIMAQFLAGHQSRVVGVHCNHGKGRTGTIISCFLLFCQMFKGTELAKQFYAKKRFEKQQGFGVTQPCQIQYIKYFEQILKGSKKLPRVVTIRKLSFLGPHKFSTLYFKIRSFIDNKTLLSTKNSQTNSLSNKTNQQQLSIKVLQNRYFAGDVKLQIKAPTSISSSTVATFSFNTAFLNDNIQEFRINMDQLSPYSLQKTDSFSPNFHIIINFKPICQCPPELDFHLRCEKCRQKLLEQEQKWKIIRQSIHRRNKMSQDQLFELLGIGKEKLKKQEKVQQHQMIIQK